MSYIIIDSREQRPYSFPGAVTRKLDAGDYSITGQETTFALERKSLSDLVSTVVHNRRRFCAELRKLNTYDYAAVVVEESIDIILAGYYKSEIKPSALLGIICGLMLRFPRVHWLFCASRPHAHAVVTELLKLRGAICQ